MVRKPALGMLAPSRQPDAKAAYARHHYQRNKDQVLLRARERHYNQSYGLTLEQYSEWCIRQEHTCAICRCITDKLFIDHDHKTGALRDLLCTTCNTGIGGLRDDPDLCDAAAAYLRRHA